MEVDPIVIRVCSLGVPENDGRDVYIYMVNG